MFSEGARRAAEWETFFSKVRENHSATGSVRENHSAKGCLFKNKAYQKYISAIVIGLFIILAGISVGVTLLHISQSILPHAQPIAGTILGIGISIGTIIITFAAIKLQKKRNILQKKRDIRNKAETDYKLREQKIKALIDDDFEKLPKDAKQISLNNNTYTAFLLKNGKLYTIFKDDSGALHCTKIITLDESVNFNGYLEALNYQRV